MRALLDAAGETDPVVLLGASWGGILVRSFYTQFPSQVAGMVLLDSTHEDTNRAYDEHDPVEAPLPLVIGTWTQPLGVQRLVGFVEKGVAKEVELSDDDRSRLVATYGQSHTAQTIVDEMVAVDAVLSAGEEAPSLGDIPLLVLQRDVKPREDDMDDQAWEQATREEEIKQRLQRDLASKSTRGEWRQVEGSGHAIAKDAPEVTLAAILEVVAAVRLSEVDGHDVRDAGSTGPGPAEGSTR